MSLTPAPAASASNDLLRTTFALYRRAFPTFVGIAAAVEVPVALVAVVGGLVPEGLGLMLLAGTMWLVGVVLEAAAICYAAWHLYDGKAANVRVAYRHVWHRGWTLFRALVLLLIALFTVAMIAWRLRVFALTGLRMLPVPGADAVAVTTIEGLAGTLLYAGLVALGMAPWMLAAPVLAIEPPRGARAALWRSFALVRGSWWRTAVGLLALAVLGWGIPGYTAFSVAAMLRGAMPGLPAAGGAGPMLLPVPESLIGNALSVLLGPLLWIGLTVLYHDRRAQVDAAAA